MRKHHGRWMEIMHTLALSEGLRRREISRTIKNATGACAAQPAEVKQAVETKRR